MATKSNTRLEAIPETFIGMHAEGFFVFYTEPHRPEWKIGYMMRIAGSRKANWTAYTSSGAIGQFAKKTDATAAILKAVVG